MLAKTLLLISALAWKAAASGPVRFCKKSDCSGCSVEVATKGKGYPRCVVYSSKQAFHGGGFPKNGAGGYAAFVHVAQPDPECSVIISSPADVDQQNCGYPIASFTHSACAKLDLHETFMVSFCCGTKDCKAAGAERRDLLDDYSDEDDMVLTVNGTVLEPLQVGYPPQEPELVAARDPPAALAPVKRAKGRCHHNWKAKKGKNSFTADSKTRIEVLDDYSGGTATITKTRSQSWTHDVSVSFGLTFEDVLSLGVSMGESFTKEVSDSSSYSFHAPKGQVGSVVFTPKLLCTTGEGTCDGGKVKGTLCSPYHPDGPNRLSGTYGLVVHG